jgi:hypothetical protein
MTPASTSSKLIAAQRAYWRTYHRENRDVINARKRMRWAASPEWRKRRVRQHREWRARKRAKGERPS